MQQEANKFTDFSLDRSHLKRSNALRIKLDNFELLPGSLKESLLVLRKRLGQARREASSVSENCVEDCELDESDESEEEEEGELSLLEQIKRGVKLRPVSSRGPRKQLLRLTETEETLSSLLVRVLKQRHEAMQQTDDEDSDSSSISVDEPQSGCKIGNSIKCYESLNSRRRSQAGETIRGARRRAARSLLAKLGEDLRIVSSDLAHNLTVKL